MSDSPRRLQPYLRNDIDESEVASLYVSGASVPELAARFATNVGTIRARLKRTGTPIRKTGGIANKELDLQRMNELLEKFGFERFADPSPVME